MIQREIFIFDVKVKHKNKAIKRILDMLDMCHTIRDSEREALRSIILDEINSLYRNLMESNGDEE